MLSLLTTAQLVSFHFAVCHSITANGVVGTTLYRFFVFDPCVASPEVDWKKNRTNDKQIASHYQQLRDRTLSSPRPWGFSDTDLKSLLDSGALVPHLYGEKGCSGVF